MEKIEKAEVLQETYLTPSSTYDGKFSKTSQFMVPSISINLLNPLVFKFFQNAYLSDAKHEHNYIRPIFLLFAINNLKDKDWEKVYNKLIQSPNYMAEYDIGIQNGKFLLMIVFQVPLEFETDYVNFKLGRYSQFTDKYKEKFPKFLDKAKKKKNIHWQIIHKDEDLKREIEKEYLMDEGELDKPTKWKGETYPSAKEIWDKPDKKREIYRYGESPSLS